MIERDGSRWRHYQGALIPDCAPHVEIVLSEEEIAHLLKTSGAYFIRWVSDFDSLEECAFWYVIKEGREELSEYRSKMRNQIKKGLRSCSVRRVEADFIAANGYDVYRKAFKKYDTFSAPVSREAFQKGLEALRKLPEWEFWGVLNGEGDLIAYSQNRIENGSCNYSTVKFDPDYLNLYPSYALFFEMNRHYLNDRGLKYVSDGARSISHKTNIQTFLIEKFMFRRAYCRLNIVYAPGIKLLVNFLYPFRHIIAKLNTTIARKITVLLTQEVIRRSFER